MVWPANRARLLGFTFAFLIGASAAAAQDVSFNADVAPILFAKCAACHHGTGPGPFTLLTYASARQHATQIAAATRARYMPPWKAEPGYGGPFLDQHPLSSDEIDLIQRWTAGGAPEGAGAPPAAPVFADGWQLGQPDLVVSTPAYTLPAGGADLFRVFVIPLRVASTRFVRGLELHPNGNAIHHANIRIDRTAASREFDAADPGPGYSGLIARTAEFPDGHFLAWTPGQVPPLLPRGLAWRLEPGTDLVIELHLQPTGRPETVQPSIGLYFSSDPPERTPAMLRLSRQKIDIAAGDSHYVVSDSFVLPVGVDVLALQPHAHQHAREVQARAVLPDGTTQWLLYIKDWDFRWQHVFRLAAPLTLPAGSRLTMQWTYDNSEANPRLPDPPPRRVGWGQRSTDEMGDLWIQVMTRNASDLDTLVDRFRPKALAEDVVGYESWIAREPDSAALRDTAAMLYLDLGQPAKAAEHFARTAALAPSRPAAHFNLATALTLDGNMRDAAREYAVALALKPDYALAHNNLGSVLLAAGDAAHAAPHFREAVRIDPSNAEAHYNLGRANRALDDFHGAAESFARAVALKPSFASAIADLSWLRSSAPDEGLRDSAAAVALGEKAVAITGGRDAAALDALGAAYASAGDFDRAAQTLEAALRLAHDAALASGLRQRLAMYKQHRPYRLARGVPGV